jgi:hypothetical protein
MAANSGNGSARGGRRRRLQCPPADLQGALRDLARQPAGRETQIVGAEASEERRHAGTFVEPARRRADLHPRVDQFTKRQRIAHAWRS